MMDNIIKAYLHGKTVCKTAPVYQYNSGMVLELVGADLPANYRADFSNSENGTSNAVLGTGTTVSVPYEYFIPGATIHCWIVISGDDYTVTKLHIMIPVSGRAQPTDEEPTPDEQGIIDQAINALNEAVAATGQDVISANEAKNAAQTAQAGAETAQQAAEAAREVAISIADDVAAVRRIASLDDTPIAGGQVLEIIGIPAYVSDVNGYTAYGLTEKGWYAFARVTAKGETTVSAETTVTGAAGYVAQIGEKYVDVAVRFDTTAQSQTVKIYWGPYTDSFVFKASDLAVRNLDYRVTFYIYDIAPYCVWTFALTADTAFVADKKYYTLDAETGEYTLATVTAGDAVPADTYYNHSLLTISGMVKNVTYELNEAVDCGMKIILPAIEEDGHGAWFDFHFYNSASGSVELVTPAGVKKATATGSASVTAGVNAIELRYTTAKEKLWSMFNEHTNVPAS